MTPGHARVLPVRPVHVPQYVPEAGSGAVPNLVRAGGTVHFDPAILAGTQRTAAQAPELGALQGLVAVPGDVVLLAGPSRLVNIGGRTVSLTPLWQPGGHDVTVCGVYDPLG